MDIKKTYTYFLKENLLMTAIIYSIVVAVTLLVTLFAFFVGERYVVSDLVSLIPSFFTVLVVSFIFSLISNNTMDLACNQFGKSRKTSYISNILVMVSISFLIAFVFSTLTSFFYKSQYTNYLMRSSSSFGSLYSGNDTKYLSYFSYWLYNFAYYTYISIAASTVGIFIYSLWARLEKLYRWIVFLFIPVTLAYVVPRVIIYFFFESNGRSPMNFFVRIIKLFGLENGFGYQFIFVSIILTVIPLLIVSYFIMLKKPLYGKKK